MTTPVLELRWTDTETSGLADSLDEAIALDRQVIEYAFVHWRDGEILNRFEKKVMPVGDAIADCVDLASKGYNHFTGVANWMNPVEGAHRTYSAALPWAAEDCEVVYDFLVDGCMAGSNPRFDLDMYKAQFHKLGHLDGFPKLATHRKVDIGQGAWYLFAVGLVDRTGLEPLAKHLGIEHKSHTAMGDVLASIASFERLVDEYINRPRRMLELLRAIAEGGPLTLVEFEELRAEIAALGPGL